MWNAFCRSRHSGRWLARSSLVRSKRRFPRGSFGYRPLLREGTDFLGLADFSSCGAPAKGRGLRLRVGKSFACQVESSLGCPGVLLRAFGEQFGQFSATPGLTELFFGFFPRVFRGSHTHLQQLNLADPSVTRAILLSDGARRGGVFLFVRWLHFYSFGRAAWTSDGSVQPPPRAR